MSQTRHIRLLPPEVADLIAAGEVVQRPASAVKELMENALDAGAGRVDVTVTDAGRTLIRVSDDGCGMTAEEAELCFARHATSKIATARDIATVATFGFRGEALASIAAVSEVTLRTRREEDEVGTRVEMAASEMKSSSPVSCPKGSDFSVRNLFYNVPARRKFLKSDNVEFRHILEEFERVALTSPDRAFSLSHNGKEVFMLRKAKSLKFRIQELFGSSVADSLAEISTQTSLLGINGYISRPDQARKTLGNQFFFINGRYFRSPYLHRAVMNAYEGLVPDGAVPAYFLYIQTDPASVDVNVHPSKTEIKFEEEQVVFQTVYAAVKEAIGRNSFGLNLEFTDAGETSPRMPVFSSRFEDFRPVQEAPQPADTGYDPFEDGDQGAPESPSRDFSGGSAAGFGTRKYVSRDQDYGKLFEDRSLQASSVMVCAGRYLLSPVASGILVVHLRRARERILYERLLRAVEKGERVSQSALFPVNVEVGAKAVSLFEEYSDRLSSLGFDISPFGKDTVVVSGLPEGFSYDRGKVEALVGDLLATLSDGPARVKELADAAICERLAASGSSAGSTSLSPAEAQGLIDSLFMCENSEFTPRGRRIMAIMSADAIGALFK